MEVRLLGPVEAWAGSDVLPLGPPRQRAVLAALAVDAGRVVSVEALIDRVWGSQAPSTARRTLQSHLARTRQVLRDGADAAAADRPVRLLRNTGGYLLAAAPDQVDLYEFRRLVAAAREPDAPDRLALLRSAVELWRGDPLSGVPGEWAAGVRAAWQQERLEALVDWADAELLAGQPAVVIAPLHGLVEEHPLAEPVWAVLIRALAAGGRAAEALERYAAVRDRLLDELGTEPGAELRALHQALLADELPDPAAVAGPPPRVVPAQLPAAASGFVGRTAELAQLDQPRDITVLAGTAGVGKTALAVRWAYRNLDAFPDGQLYVNLRGYDPDQPVRPADALAGMLLGLGLAAADVPPAVDDRAARFRTEVAGRRLLVVLDNASTPEQVRPLLPGAPGCRTLITSRDALAGLVATHGARRLDLDPLSEGEAIALLRGLLGVRAQVEPAAVRELAEQCARLPLALRVAAELAVSRIDEPLRALVAELADRQLELLDGGGDPRAAVAAVFSWSLRHLPVGHAHAFTVLGLHPGPDFDAYAAAALTGTGHAEAARALTALARAHLLHPAGAGRYGMHDLLRAYAMSLPGAEPAARDRLLRYYLATCAAAMNTLAPAEAPRRPRVPPSPAPAPDLSEPEAALRWLDAERASLVLLAAGDEHAVTLSQLLFRYLAGAHHLDGLTVHGHARAAARRAGDVLAEATAENGLGAGYLRLARYAEADASYARAIELGKRAGDHDIQARANTNRSIVADRLGRYEVAAGYARAALDLCGEDDYPARASATSQLALLLNRSSQRKDEVIELLEEALSYARTCRDPIRQADITGHLGVTLCEANRPAEGSRLLDEAVERYRQLGHLTGEAIMYCHLGMPHFRVRTPAECRTLNQRALEMFRQTGDRDCEPWALNGLGEAAIALADPDSAIDHFTAALAIAESTDALDQQIRAHQGLGAAHQALADATTARRHYEHALTIASALGTAEVPDIRAALAALPAEPREATA